MKTEREIEQEVTVQIDPEKLRKWKKPTCSDVTEEELSNSKKGKNNNKGKTKKKVGGRCSMRGSVRGKAKQTPTPADIPEEQLNAKDEEIAKASSEERKEIESLKRQLKLWLFLKNSQMIKKKKTYWNQVQKKEVERLIKVNIRKVLQREKEAARMSNEMKCLQVMRIR